MKSGKAVILPAGPKAYARAADILRGGGLVALPTETVYGLAADAMNNAAVARIYAAKGRPSHNPLIVHVLSPDDADIYARVSGLSRDLITAFWPGPLTLVLPRRETGLSAAAGAGLPTIAIRCPDAPWRSALCGTGLSGPLVMPSANRSGHVSPTSAVHVAADLGGRVDMIIDGGPCAGGIESTILKIDGDKVVLLRPGTLPAERFAPYISDLRLPEKSGEILAPGMLKSHYAPKAFVRLNAREKRADEAYLAFGETDIDADMNLSPDGDLAEAARNLYQALRALDTKPVIAVAPIPMYGIGEAINDRLRRAAAER